MSKVHTMFAARWDAGTGFGPRIQPLTLAFWPREVAERADKMAGPAFSGFEIIPVTVTIEERSA